MEEKEQKKVKLAIIVNNLLSSRLNIIILFFLLVLKTHVFYRNINLDIGLFSNTNFISLQFILVAICPLLFIKKDKNRFLGMIIYDILFSLLLFVDNVYYEYSYNMLSICQILYVKYAEEIGAALPGLLHFNHIFYLLDIVLLIIVWKVAKSKTSLSKAIAVPKKESRKWIFGALLTITIIFVTHTGRSAALNMIEIMPYQRILQVELGSIYGYHFADIYDTINIRETTAYKTYDNMMNDYKKIADYKEQNFKKKEELYGIAEGKNVIILQLESVQNFVVNRTINGKEITPNLNKFLKENITFSNMIVQSYSTTADSEYSVLTSLYPLENGQAFSNYYSNINNDLFRAYKEKGYKTAYMHGNIEDFWNRHRSIFKT